MPFKRLKYTPPEAPSAAQPASKRPRIGASSATGPSPGSISKYSADSNSKLYRMLAENFPDSSKKLLSMAYSNSTWRSYESAWNCFKSFELDTSSIC